MPKMGFGIIGAGVWGETHAMTYSAHPDAELVMVCDLDAERARTIAENYNAREWTTDYENLLARDDIQAVSIVTPDFAHREIAVAAAQAGKHILVEKPLATTIEDCEAIINAAKQANVKLMVDFHNRFNPPHIRVKEALDE
ncbi:MAG TPA: Gfo/Idh/MocA family oxidoreductase, partial [Armatimonadetes bacterium]|nr:Gfo/Idh/MocA family oxidoreductase [Armatimonadota bacterium]